jgi:hypothetical protein
MSTELLEARSMECASFIVSPLRDLQHEHGDDQLAKAAYQDLITEVRQQFLQAEMQEAFKIMMAWARYDEEHGSNDIRSKFSVIAGLDTEHAMFTTAACKKMSWEKAICGKETITEDLRAVSRYLLTKRTKGIDQLPKSVVSRARLFSFEFFQCPVAAHAS